MYRAAQSLYGIVWRFFCVLHRQKNGAANQCAKPGAAAPAL